MQPFHDNQEYNAMNLIKTAQFRFGIEFLHTKFQKGDFAVMQQKNHVGSLEKVPCMLKVVMLSGVYITYQYIR